MTKNKNAARTTTSNTKAPQKAAPKPPASVTPIKKSEEVEIEDEDEDDEDEEVEVATTAGAKKERKTQKQKFVGKLITVRKHIDRLFGKSDNAPRLHAAMAELSKRAALAIDEAQALSDDWKRAAAERVSKSFNPGDIVKMNPAFVAQYEGLFEDGDLDELVVVKQIGKKLVIRSASGVRTMLPSHHVTQ